MRDGHVGSPLISRKNVHGAFSCVSIVVEGHSPHFMVFWDGVGAKRELMTCWVRPRGDLLRREFRVLICREPPRTADGTSPARPVSDSRTPSRVVAPTGFVRSWAKTLRSRFAAWPSAPSEHRPQEATAARNQAANSSLRPDDTQGACNVRGVAEALAGEARRNVRDRSGVRDRAKVR